MRLNSSINGNVLRVGFIPYIGKRKCFVRFHGKGCLTPGLYPEIAGMIGEALKMKTVMVKISGQKFDNAPEDMIEGKYDMTAPAFQLSPQRLEHADFIPVRVKELNAVLMFSMKDLKLDDDYFWYKMFSPDVWVVFFGAFVMSQILSWRNGETGFNPVVFASNMVSWLTIFVFHIIFETLVLESLITSANLPFSNLKDAETVVKSGLYRMVIWYGTEWARLSLHAFGNSTYNNGVGSTVLSNLPDLLCHGSRFLMVGDLDANALEKSSGGRIIRSPETITTFQSFTTSLLPYGSKLKRPVTKALNWMQQSGYLAAVYQRYTYEYHPPRVFSSKTNTPLGITDTASIFLILTSLSVPYLLLVVSLACSKLC